MFNYISCIQGSEKGRGGDQGCELKAYLSPSSLFESQETPENPPAVAAQTLGRWGPETKLVIVINGSHVGKQWQPPDPWPTPTRVAGL